MQQSRPNYARSLGIIGMIAWSDPRYFPLSFSSKSHGGRGNGTPDLLPVLSPIKDDGGGWVNVVDLNGSRQTRKSIRRVLAPKRWLGFACCRSPGQDVRTALSTERDMMTSANRGLGS